MLYWPSPLQTFLKVRISSCYYFKSDIPLTLWPPNETFLSTHFRKHWGQPDSDPMCLAAFLVTAVCSPHHIAGQHSHTAGSNAAELNPRYPRAPAPTPPLHRHRTSWAPGNPAGALVSKQARRTQPCLGLYNYMTGHFLLHLTINVMRRAVYRKKVSLSINLHIHGGPDLSSWQVWQEVNFEDRDWVTQVRACGTDIYKDPFSTLKWWGSLHYPYREFSQQSLIFISIWFPCVHNQLKGFDKLALPQDYVVIMCVNSAWNYPIVRWKQQ